AMKRSLVMAFCALVCACTGTETRLPTDTPPDTTGTGGGVRRATVLVTVPVLSADAAVGAALGWVGVPAATVVLQRTGSPQSQTATTDASCEASFTNLLPGEYSVSVLRTLTQAERGLLGPADADVDAFGGGVAVQVSAPTTAVQVPAAAGRRGSLVISELWTGMPFQSVGPQYVFGNWMELYNNSDTVIAIAGKLVFSAVPGWYEHPIYPCTVFEPVLADSLGIWVDLVYAFPPTAAPIAPGGLVVIATDAIDHTQLATGTYDLSRAQFEFRGGSDADNPSALDMVSVGTRDGGFIQGHGMYFIGAWQPWGIANAVDLTALPRFRHPFGDFDYIRLPAVEVLDLVTVRVPSVTQGYPDCKPPIHSLYDRQAVSVSDPEPSGLQRVPLHRDGMHPVLLRTKTSARDFRLQSPTPGTLP
ncbi:MAG: hypothetical protein ACR2HZ_06055, partial [Gemmatimonadaceae bacterium]